MKTMWYIAKKDLLQTLKDRNSFFLLLAVPLILIVVIGLAFGNLFGGGQKALKAKEKPKDEELPPPLPPVKELPRIEAPRPEPPKVIPGGRDT